MKNRRFSEISESEESDKAPGSKNSSNVKASTVNNNGSSSDSSVSSSDSEQAPKRSSSLLNRTPPSISPKKSVSISPIKKFIMQNPDLTQVHINDVLSEDDDVCFLEIPKTIDPEQLLGKVINFDRRTKIKVNKTRYVIEPNDESVKPFTILTNKLKILHPIANLQLREYTKRKGDGGLVESEKFTPSLPDNLKVRHPLFGAKYENKIVLDEEIEQKLNNTIDQFMKTRKKKKKKKHKERVEEEEQPTESIFTLLESHSLGKKKHKETNQELAHTSLDEEDQDQSFKKKHKKKKEKKKGVEDAEFPSFEEPEVLKMKTKVNSQESPSTSFLERDGFKKRHKKKKRVEDEELTLPSFKDPENYGKEVPNINTSQESTTSFINRDSSKKKDKKKKQTEAEGEVNQGNKAKKNNLINSTIIPGLQLPSFDFDISSIMNKEERLERKKTNCADDSGDEFKLDDISIEKKRKNELLDNLNNRKQKPLDSFEDSKDTSKKKKKRDKPEDEDGGVSPKKKRKKDKEESRVTNSLILDILSHVKNEMDASISKHKKKKKSER